MSIIGLLRVPRMKPQRLARRAVSFALRMLFGDPPERPPDPRLASVRVQQLALMNDYRLMVATGAPLPAFADVGFRVHSQNDEDGVLLFVFALLGFTNRVLVEIAAGDGVECNGANLIVNHGFSGLLFEGDTHLVEIGRAFYERRLGPGALHPRFVGEWVTRENVNTLVERNMFAGGLPPSGEIDLLSLDLDGNDYWVLEALTCVAPRVIVCEFNAAWGAERALTIPYDPRFRAYLEPVPYMGASLPAFVKLLRGRGYRLVGVERLGFNAVFVKGGLVPDLLPERSAAECLAGPTVSILQAGLRVDPRLTAHLRERPWVEV